MSGLLGFGTGHGTVITFTQLTGTYFTREIQLHEESGPSADISGLGSSNARTYVPPDLMDIGAAQVTLVFDTDQGLPAERTKDSDIIITFPIRTAGNTTNATLHGPGWISRRNYGNLQSNVEQLAVVDIQWETKPAFTLEAA